MLKSQTCPVQNCPLCAASVEQSAPFNRCIDHDVCWRYVVCKQCGLVYQSRRIRDDALEAHYADEYWEHQGQAGQPDASQIALQSGRAENLLNCLGTDFELRRLLEIGSGAGYLLRAARERFGAEAVGVELSRQFRDFCHQDGLEVYAYLNEVDVAQRGRFDAIAMSHVLEHVAEPVSFLKHLRTEYLADQGRLLLEVPNLYAHRSFEATHTVCFTEKTLEKALTKAGYRLQHLSVHNAPRTSIDRPLYITAAAGPSDQAEDVSFERPNVWLERVKRAYIAKGGPWPRRLLKGVRIGVTSLAVQDLQY